MYKLLIVDDEAIIRRGIKTFVDFEKLSISEVFEASNGKEAIEVFNKEKPDIILADINMPIMNGLDMASKIKEIDKNVKIAVITGYDYFDYAVVALKTGIDDYILKPVSRKDIETILVKLIKRITEESKGEEIKKVALNIVEHDGDDNESIMNKIIEENIGNSDLSLQFLADKMGFSSGYLSGLFKRTFGETFSDYVLNKRLDKAKILLLSTNYKMYEIGDLVGFTDPNYFSAIFKKKIGMSPNQFRNSVKE